METFSALLTICAGNSPGTGKFPAQRPVTRSFDVFEKPSSPLWRRCNALFETLLHELTFKSLSLFSAKISNEFVATAFLFRINCYKLYVGISVLIICHSSASGFTFSHDWCPRGLRQPCLRCRSRVIIIFAIYQLMYQLNSYSNMKNLSIRCVRTYLKVCVNGRS